MVCNNVDSVVFLADMLFLSTNGKDDIDFSSGPYVVEVEAGTPMKAEDEVSSQNTFSKESGNFSILTCACL